MYDEKENLITDNKTVRIIAVMILIVFSIGIRMYGNIWKPDFDFKQTDSSQNLGFYGKHVKQLRHMVEVSPTRSYHSAMIARYFYYKSLKPSEKWKDEVIKAQISRSTEPIAEDYCPPVMEWLTAFLFRVSGTESLLIPQMLASLIWLAGGWLIYGICRRFCGFEGSFVASAIFLLAPFGIYTSRVHLPDSLWLISMLVGLFCMIKYYEKPDSLRFLLLVIISALSSFIKPMNLFFIFAAYIALYLAQEDKKVKFFDKRSLLFYLTSIMPPLLFYFSVKSGEGALPAKRYFIFNLLTNRFFYEEWFFFVRELSNLPGLVLGITGILFFRRREGRYLACSMWIIFIVIGIAFNHAINTYHDCYVLQLMPALALSLGFFANSIIDILRKRAVKRYIQVVLCLLLTAYTVYSLRPVRWSIQKNNFAHRIDLSHKVGEIVNHSTRTIFLAPSFGKPLMYDAWIAGETWPTGWYLWKKWKERESSASALVDHENFLKNFKMSSEEIQKLFESQYGLSHPEYFIITDFEEFKEQPGLKEFLEKNFSVLAATDWYLIFDLRHKNNT